MGTATSGRKQTEKPFRDMLALAIQGTKGDMAELRSIAKKLVAKAKGGDIQAIKEVADRLDGKVPQGNEHTLEPSDALSALMETIDGKSRTKPEAS